MKIVRILAETDRGDALWEQAYVRFETAEQETRKFLRRLQQLGATAWPRDAQVVELFCGQGNGLKALEALGFQRLEGVDLSERLLRRYNGPATLYVCDCRRLPFADGSRDIVIVQGGLHHLREVPDDLEDVLREIRRVLRPQGHLVVVEPWLTPFLRVVHSVCRNRLARRLSRRIGALAVMIEREGRTYEGWLSHPAEIHDRLEAQFRPDRLRIRWGKLMFVGRPTT